MEFKPHKYQSFCINKIINTPRTALMIDMGLGKTVCALTAIKDLIYDKKEISTALVVAPKKVAETTWPEEIAKWDHLKDLKYSSIFGGPAARKLAVAEKADIYIVSRDNFLWVVEHYGYTWPFDMLVIDESSGFKSHTSKRFKAAKAIIGKCKRVLELTGTPAPQNLLDLWAQIYLLDGGERLGKYFGRYREIFFQPDKRSRTVIFSYKLIPGAEKEIEKKISDICVSMKAEDYLNLPEMIVNDVRFDIEGDGRTRYDSLEREALLMVDESTVTAANAAALTSKLLQLCSGAVYGSEGEVVEIHPCKIEAAQMVIEQLLSEGRNVIVYYKYKHDLSRLFEACLHLASGGFEKARNSKGRKTSVTLDDSTVRVYRGPEEERDWNAGKIKILFAHPASCGYGLNLQKGGRDIIWFGLTWNLEEYLQANKRLHRQGQTKPVVVHRLIAKNSMDENVVLALEKKNAGQDGLLEALKARKAVVDSTPAYHHKAERQKRAKKAAEDARARGIS